MLLLPPANPLCSWASVSLFVFSLIFSSASSPSLHYLMNFNFFVSVFTFSPSFSGWSFESRFSSSSLRSWKLPIFSSYSFSFLYSLYSSTSLKCYLFRSFSSWRLSCPTSLIRSYTMPHKRWYERRLTLNNSDFCIEHIMLEFLHLKVLVKALVKLKV